MLDDTAPEAGDKPKPRHSGHRDRLRERAAKGGLGALPDYELLELLLFGVTTVNGIGVRLDDYATAADLGPQHAVVEVAAIDLAHRVVEVLHIGEYGDLLHRESSGATKAPVCQSWAADAAGAGPSAAQPLSLAP